MGDVTSNAQRVSKRVPGRERQEVPFLEPFVSGFAMCRFEVACGHPLGAGDAQDH
jgi:hypothetical protein